MRDYDRKRMNAVSQAEDRKRILESRFPEIFEIEQEIKTVGMSIMKKVLTKGVSREEATKECEKRMEELKEKKYKIYSDNKIPFNYTDPIYECCLCNDTGMLENGKKCKCYEIQLIEETSEASYMKNLLETQNFESMDMNIFSKEKNKEGISQLDIMNSNVGVAKEFIDKFNEKESFSLLFYGETGVGKTFLSSCIAREILNKGYTVIYKTSSQIIDLAKAITFTNSSSDRTKEEYSFLESCDLLIIDDLGTEMANRFVVSEIYKIINLRLVAGKKVIISTNLNLKELNDIYTDRVFYRLIEGYKMLEFVGPNLRLEKVKRRYVEKRNNDIEKEKG